jgi:hypothetical protein
MINNTATCNKCGKTTVRTYSDDFKTINLDFGYGSRFDGERWIFGLCDDCLEDMVREFKYVPSGFKIHNVLPLSDTTHQKVFEDWKKSGEWEDLKYYTYEELVELNGYLDTGYINEYIEKYHKSMPLLGGYQQA